MTSEVSRVACVFFTATATHWDGGLRPFGSSLSSETGPVHPEHFLDQAFVESMNCQQVSMFNWTRRRGNRQTGPA